MKVRFEAVLIALASFFAGCESLIFHPRAASYEDSTVLTKVPISADESEGELVAAYFPARGPQAWPFTILYSHGNSEDLGDIASKLRWIQSLGFSVFAYDYEGYGQSDGHASVANTERDVEAAYRFVTETMKVDPRRVILWGRSVGSGPTLYIASRALHAGLILESAFLGAYQTVIPWGLPGEPYPNAERISGLNSPLLVVHGRQDRVVPFWHGPRLAALSASEAPLTLFVDSGHNNLLKDHEAQLRKAVTVFAARLAGEYGLPFPLVPSAGPQAPEITESKTPEVQGKAREGGEGRSQGPETSGSRREAEPSGHAQEPDGERGSRKLGESKDTESSEK